MRRTTAWAVVAAAMLASSAASAQATDKEAERLFKEGQELLERGQYQEACDDLDRSLRLDENVNTLGLLAICHEKIGKPGKAWNEFKRIETKVSSGEKAAVVAQHLKRLDGQVARARLDVGNRTITEARVDSDIAVLDQGRVVADPGDHTIRVDAGGRTLTRNTTLKLGDNPDIVMTDDVPPPRAGAPLVASEPHDTATRAGGDGNGRRVLGWVITGVGVVGLGLGTFFGIATIETKKDADNTCNPSPGDGKCQGTPGKTSPTDATTEAETKRQNAITTSWLSTAGFGVGLVGVAVGVYLVATSSSSAPTTITTGSVRWTPEVGPRSLGVAASF